MTALLKESARWFARMQHAAPDHPDRGRFEAWLAADPAHAAAYAKFQKIWGRFDSTQEAQALAGAFEAQRTAQSDKRRRVLKHGLLGLFCAGGAAGALYRHWQDETLWQAAWTTGLGQVARRVLDDGSTLVLGGNAQVEAAFSRSRRAVDMRRGEVIFDVARDTTRPFVVDAGIAQVTVRGTRFCVSRLSDRVRVSVEHGVVDVASGPFWRRRNLTVRAGEVVEVEAFDTRPSAPHFVARDASDAFSFETGALTFNKVPLAELAETLSRYRVRPLGVQPGAEGAPPITAVVQINGIEGFLRALPSLAPVTVRDRDGKTWLGTGPAAPRAGPT